MLSSRILVPAGAGEPAHDFGHERDATLAFDDFLGHSDQHGRGKLPQ